MFTSAILFGLVALVTGSKITEEDYRILVSRREIIDAVNAKGTTWKAGVNTRFANATVADVKRMLGTILPGCLNFFFTKINVVILILFFIGREEGYIAPDLTRTEFKYDKSAVPASFDVRTNWPACSAITGRVRDQSSCGSCWAFGSTEAFNDRYCITTGDSITVLAPEDTNDCCTGLRPPSFS